MWKKLDRGFLGFVAAALILGVGSDSATAQDAPKLKYGFQKDRHYAFDVKISAQLTDEEVTHQGVLTYTALSATDDQFALKCIGILGKSVKATGESTSGFGVRHGFGDSAYFGDSPSFSVTRGFSSRYGLRRTEGTTFTRQGGVVIFGNSTSLPYLLGNDGDFIIEALPAEAETTWNKQTDISVIERNMNETGRVAKEQIDYAILETKGDSIRISKKYSLKTVAEENGKSHLNMTGSGEFEFDVKEGIIKSQSMKYDIQVNEKNVAVTIPVTVSYNLVSDAVLAERKKKAEEEAAAIAEANRPKPLEPGEKEKLLKELQSDDEKRIQTAAKRLAKSVADNDPADLSKALCQAFKKTNPWIQKDVLDALNIWITSDAEKTVIEACGSSHFFVRDAAITMLGKFKTAAAAKAVAKFYAVNRRAAAAAFKAMGPFAEPYVIPLLKNEDFWLRKEACDLLAEIGGKESLAKLKSIKPMTPQDQLGYLNHAITAIELRVGADEDDSPAAEEADTPAAKEDDSPAAGPGDPEVDAAVDMLTKTLPPGTEVDREELKKVVAEMKEDAESGDPARIQAAQAKLLKAITSGKSGKTTKPAGKSAAAKTATAKTATAKPGAKPKLHVWHDASGTYEVEAAFVKTEGDKVTIKRADGKTITLAIKKLSKADQDYVEQQKGVSENPFE